MSNFDRLNSEMGLLETRTYNNTDAKSGTLDTFYNTSRINPTVTTQDTSGINRFILDSDEVEDEELLVDGEDDTGTGYTITSQKRNVKEVATFDPSTAVGRDGNYIQNIRVASAYRDVGASIIALDDNGDASLGETGGDEDYLRTGEIAFDSTKDSGGPSAVDLANNLGKYKDSRIDENAAAVYTVSDEEKELLTTYENLTVENALESLIEGPYKSIIKNTNLN